ncbi:MAG: hypothetical protein HY047_00910 [Acidobacteria bacterium]|nr:hypothetical protein [Acidobacteriota bacterium]
MKRLTVLTASLLLFGPASFAAEQTFAGQISDSACNSKHESGAENVPTPPDHDCTLDCVRGGSKFVLVSNGKVYQIANQDLADLKTHAGHNVKMTGDLKGDAITVTKIEMQ